MAEKPKIPKQPKKTAPPKPFEPLLTTVPGLAEFIDRCLLTTVPGDARITSFFKQKDRPGCKDRPNHYGTDIMWGPPGGGEMIYDSVRAPFGGVVVAVSKADGMVAIWDQGRFVVFRHMTGIPEEFYPEEGSSLLLAHIELIRGLQSLRDEH
ncbi:MAG: hypothetical protein AB1649_23025 [Chloroflexota bacterium]